MRVFLWRKGGSLMVAGGLLALVGCWGGSSPRKPSVPSFQGISLKVAALDDPAILTGVRALRGEWEASRGGAIAVTEQQIAVESPLAADVVVFSGQRLGDLVDAQALAVIPNEAVMPPKPTEAVPGEPADRDPGAAGEQEAGAFQFMDIAPAFRDQVSRYGKDRLALPCGASALVLAYRRDAFESESNRAAARTAGLELRPPSTWSELDALAKFFQNRDWNGDGKPDHGIVMAMGADQEGVGDTVFLARAASLGQHRDQFSFLFDSETCAPRVDSPPFVEALKGVIGWKALGPPGVEKFDASRARGAFRAGQSAMLIDRAERVAGWSGGKPVGVVALPGSERVFEPLRKQWTEESPPNRPSYLPRGGGWLIGISTRTTGKEREAAIDFAKYLASPDNLNRLRSEQAFPMLPVRTAQIGQGLSDPTQAPDVDMRQWSVAVAETLQLNRVVPGLRIHAADGYLSDLSKARMAALSGMPPEEATRSVASAWAERTQKLGQRRQLWHYQRSLNSLVTLPTPPDPGK
jgi:multiple sugar transport system substrate-binding protein